MQVWHPLHRVASPRFADVLARCDDGARDLLQLAGLAQYRLAQEARADEIERPPWAEPGGLDAARWPALVALADALRGGTIQT